MKSKKNLRSKEFFIPFDVPSSKNSRVKTKRGAFIESKAMRKWRKLTQPYFEDMREDFLLCLKGKHKPYKIGFYFVRKTRHRWDFSNKINSVQDVMVEHGWLSDDNIDEMVPIPFKIDGRYYHHDKENPGVIIKIL